MSLPPPVCPAYNLVVGLHGSTVQIGSWLGGDLRLLFFGLHYLEDKLVQKLPNYIVDERVWEFAWR